MDNNSRVLWLHCRFFKLLELDRKDITYIYVYAIFAGLITLSIPLGVQVIIGLIAGGALSISDHSGCYRDGGRGFPAF